MEKKVFPIEEKCVICQATLTTDDAGMTKKLINRGAKQYYCLCCLAQHFAVSEEVLQEKMRYFKSIGCTVFPDAE